MNRLNREVAPAGADTQAVGAQVLQEAAQWYAVLSFASASAEENAQWRAWLDADEEHRRAWARVEAVDADLAAPRSLAGHQLHRAALALDTAAEQLGRRRRALRVFALACGAGAFGLGVARVPASRNWLSAQASDEHTTTGEIRSLSLAGGGRLWMASATALDWGGDPQVPGGQRLRLRQGEVLVETGHDAGARPLVVETPQGRLTPMGTRFSVRLQGEGTQTLLAVFDGRVQWAGPQTPPRTLEAGQQWLLSTEGVQSQQRVDPGREAWSRGILLVDGMRLADFVAELSRYRRGRLACAEEVADIRVTGGFPLRDTDQALALLAQALPVEVRRTLPWWVRIEPR